MAIYNQRNGTTSTNLVLTLPQMVELHYATLCGTDYLRTKHTDNQITNELKNVSLGTLSNVFGRNSSVVEWIQEVYAGSTSLVRNPAVSSAEKGASDLSAIIDNMDNRGIKLVTISVSYVELYNANNSRTVLTLPRAASVVKYHS